MKKLFALLFCAALFGASAGCSDDKDDATVDAALLVGSWRQTERYWSDEEGEGHEMVQPKEAITRTFRADGSGTERYGTYSYAETFTYWTDRYLNLDFGDGEVMTYEVETVTGAVLVLTQSGTDSDGDWFERETYERIIE